jgi:hypothetical protein
MSTHDRASVFPEPRAIYRLSDLNAYLDSRTRSSTSDPGPERE